MSGRYRVRVSGPLEGFAEGFRAELVASGYAWRTVEAQLGLVKHLSTWLGAQGLMAGDLGPEVTSRFVEARRQSHTHLRSPRALVAVLGYLRGLGVAPPPQESASTPAEVIEQEFARYLATQRRLAPATVSSYRSQVRPFLARFAEVDGGWASVTARQVRDFVTDRAAGQQPRSAAVGANAVRALLRWMWREQIVPTALDSCVGSVAAPTGTTIPRALSPGEVARLFAALPPGPAGLRNQSMLALMHRLGLRAGEVGALRLEDIDWRAGLLTVRGKGARCDQLPLPADVGKLLAAYLRHARPTDTSHRQVFLALDAPHRPLAGCAVSSVAARALTSAGIAGPGAAHRLRHTAACATLAAGGGLIEAGQLLRHADATTTAIYAKCDLTSLARLARPWPQEVAR